VTLDGRRVFASVSGTIVDVLAEANEDLRVREIQARVERILGSSVSRHSVKGYLHDRCAGQNALFERTRRGHYRLRR
jgi:hypothetical protein